MEKFLGTFTVDTSKDENSETFFENLGLPEELRQVLRRSATRIMTDNGDGSYTIEFKPEGAPDFPAVTFKLGETTEFTCPPDDAKVIDTTTLEGDVLVNKKETRGKKLTQKTAIEGDYLMITASAENGVTAKRYLRKTA